MSDPTDKKVLGSRPHVRGPGWEPRDVMSNIIMLTLVLGVPLAAAIGAVIILLVKVRCLGRQVADFPEREKEIRSDARKRSRRDLMRT